MQAVSASTGALSGDVSRQRGRFFPYPLYEMTVQPIDRRAIRRIFDDTAARFAEHDFIYRRSFDGLMERLEPMQLSTERILDLGCGLGADSRALARRYRRARIVSADLSAAMLNAARAKHFRILSRLSEVQADAGKLPFASGSFDLVVANQLLPWVGDIGPALNEIARVLRREGLFLCTALGPDSFVESRSSGGNAFIDMHDIGDAIVRAGMRDPVLDTERITIQYTARERLQADLAGAGLLALGDFDKAWPQEGRIEVTVELVFGHAWGGPAKTTPGEYAIEPGQIGRRRGPS